MQIKILVIRGWFLVMLWLLCTSSPANLPWMLPNCHELQFRGLSSFVVIVKWWHQNWHRQMQWSTDFYQNKIHVNCTGNTFCLIHAPGAATNGSPSDCFNKVNGIHDAQIPTWTFLPYKTMCAAQGSIITCKYWRSPREKVCDQHLYYAHKDKTLFYTCITCKIHAFWFLFLTFVSEHSPPIVSCNEGPLWGMRLRSNPAPADWRNVGNRNICIVWNLAGHDWKLEHCTSFNSVHLINVL